jgi:transcriptional regulator with XRE-family HTH domain
MEEQESSRTRDINQQRFARRFTLMRKQCLKLSQAELGLKLSCAPKTISAIEEGRRSVQYDLIVKFLKLAAGKPYGVRNALDAQRFVGLNSVKDVPLRLAEDDLISVFGMSYQDHIHAALPVERIPPHWIKPETAWAQLETLVEDGVRAFASIEGAAGVGKSSLALAWGAWQEEAVTFANGVYWFPAGSDKDRWHWLYLKLGVREETAARRWLRDKRALLLIDDPPDRETIDWLMSLENVSCLIVVTTRQGQWLSQVALPEARRIHLDGLTESEGLQLLEVRSAKPLTSEEQAFAAKTGQLVRWNPQMFDLLVPRSKTLGWQQVYQEVQQCLTLPLDPALRELDADQFRILQMVIARLPAEQQAWMKQLGELPRVSSFDVYAARILWQCDDVTAVERLHVLVENNLLQRTEEPDYPQCEGPRFYLHWTLWRYLRYLTGADQEEKPLVTHPGALLRFKRHVTDDLKLAREEYLFAEHPGLWFNPKEWWRPTMKGKRNALLALIDGKLGAAPKDLMPNASLWERMRHDYDYWLSLAWSQHGAILPLEAIATAECLRRRSAQVANPLRIIILSLLCVAVWVVLLFLPKDLPMAGYISVIMGAAAVVIFFYPTLVHFVNYYRFMERWLF